MRLCHARTASFHHSFSVSPAHSPRSGHVDPAKATHALCDAAVASGRCALREGVTATAVRRRATTPDAAGEYAVETADGATHAARHVVLANGAWVAPLAASLGLRVPVVPVRGQVTSGEVERADGGAALCTVLYMFGSHHAWATMPSSGRDDAAGLPACVTHDAGGTRVVAHGYGRQTADGRVIFGGDRVTTSLAATASEDAYAPRDDATTASRTLLACVAPAAARHAPCDGAWCGVMPFSRDGSPLLGECAAAGVDRVWMLGGLGAEGIMQGPMAARVVAALIAERDADDGADSDVAVRCKTDAAHAEEGGGLWPPRKGTVPHSLRRLIADGAAACRPDGGVVRIEAAERR